MLKKKLYEYRYCIYASLIVLIVWMFVFQNMGIVPFGSEQYIKYDNQHQYLPFAESFRRLLHGDGNLFFSWDMASGYDWFANFTYYMTSPFNLLLIFVPEGGTATFLSYLIVLRTCLMAFTFGFMLKKLFKIDNLSTTAFSLAYALCGFMTIYTWNTIWFDCFWLLPLVLVSLMRLIRNQKCGYYILILSLTILCNFYIGLIICLFVSLIFLIANPWKEKVGIKNLIRFTISSLLAGSINAIILIPMFLVQAQLVSGDISRTIWGAFDSFRSIFSHFFLFDNVKYSTMDYGYAPSYIGILSLWLFPQFFLLKDVSKKEKITVAILVTTMILGTNIGFLNLIFHGLHLPVGIPNRYSFITSFILLTCGARAINKTLYFSFCEKYKTAIISTVFVLSLLFISTLDVVPKAINLALIVLYVLLYILGTHKAILITMCIELGISSFMLLNGQAPNYLQYIEEADTVSDMIELKPYQQSAFDFNKMTNYSVYKNIRSYPGFSSMLNPLYQTGIDLGAGVDKNRQLEYVNPTIASLFGVNYISNQRYVTFMEPWWSKVYQNYNGNANIALFENKNEVSMAHIYPEEVKDFKLEKEDPYQNTNNLYALFAGTEKSIYNRANVSVEPVNDYMIKEARGDITEYYVSRVTFYKPGTYALFSNVVGSTAYLIEGEVNFEDIDLDASSDKYEWFTIYGLWNRDVKPLILPEVIDGGYPVTMTMISSCDHDKTIFEQINTKEAMYNPISFAKYDMDREKELTEKIDSYAIKDVNFNGNKVLIENSGDSGVLTLSTFYSDGWKVKVDGKEREISKVLDMFIGIDIDENDKHIEITYITPGFVPGLTISISSLILTTIFLLFLKKRDAN